MTEHPKSKTGSDVTDMTSGALGNTIVAWLEKCAAQSQQPRVTATAESVTLRAGPHATTLQVTPETMKAALAEYKSDARWNVAGVKHAGYTDAIYRLNAATPGYVSSGKPRTNGTAQTEGNTQTRTLGSVAKAEAAHVKAEAAAAALRVKLAAAEKLAAEKLAAIDDARQAEKLAAAAKAEAAKAEAANNRTALLAKVASLKAKAAKAAAEAAEIDKLLAEAAQA